MATLKKEVALTKAPLIEAGFKSLVPKMTSEVIIFLIDRMESQYTSKEAQNGLTKSELCALPFGQSRLAAHIGLTIYQADKATKEQGTNLNDYLFKLTGFPSIIRETTTLLPNSELTQAKWKLKLTQP